MIMLQRRSYNIAAWSPPSRKKKHPKLRKRVDQNRRSLSWEVKTELEAEEGDEANEEMKSIPKRVLERAPKSKGNGERQRRHKVRSDLRFSET